MDSQQLIILGFLAGVILCKLAEYLNKRADILSWDEKRDKHPMEN